MLAADLKFEFVALNDILSEFHPTLKATFFKKDASQGELAINAPTHLPTLRLPEIQSVKWNKDFDGYKLIVHWGATGKGDITLIDCKVDQFSFAFKEGGSVTTTFRIVCHPLAAEVGRLCELIQQDVDISLVAPDEEVQQELAA